MSESKRVPREPTPAMLSKAQCLYVPTDCATQAALDHGRAEIWRAMYDAAPAVPDERDGTELVHGSYVADTTREILALRRERDALKAALRELVEAQNNYAAGKSVAGQTESNGQRLRDAWKAAIALAAPEDAP